MLLAIALVCSAVAGGKDAVPDSRASSTPTVPPGPISCEELGFRARVGYRIEHVGRPVDVQLLTSGQKGWIEPKHPLSLPDGLVLELEGPPSFSPRLITLRALRLSGAGVTQRSLPPIGPREIYPAHSLLTLPPGGRIGFSTSVVLPCWSYTAGQKATLHYALQTSHPELTGSVDVTLP
jgi:hypothetical protein